MARLRELARDVDTSLFAEILATFRDDLEKYAAGMKRAFLAGDAEGLKREAHAMKGASMNTGAIGLGLLSSRMEEAAAAVDAPVICSLLPELEAEIHRVQADIALELSAAP
jgi:HPt (histidine-containing phosphotransfer) domain-containing protein